MRRARWIDIAGVTVICVPRDMCAPKQRPLRKSNADNEKMLKNVGARERASIPSKILVCLSFTICKKSNTSKSSKGVSFWRNCGAASVGEWNTKIWFINGVDNVNWPPYRDWKADVSNVSPSSEQIQTKLLWRRANARNVSFSILERWSIYIINSVDKPNLRVNLDFLKVRFSFWVLWRIRRSLLATRFSRSRGLRSRLVTITVSWGGETHITKRTQAVICVSLDPSSGDSF